MKNLPTVVVVVVLLLSFVQRGESQDKWHTADGAISRLAPTVFSQLPKKIIRNLTARRCSVPQSFGITTPHNVISGEFMRRGEADWAVLCSRNGFSSILIFRAGFVKSVSEIAKVADITFLQTIDGNGGIGFSRAICVVGRNYIRQHYRWYGGPKPPRINHQSINDVFVGKASTVLYYHSRKWLKLQGAD